MSVKRNKKKRKQKRKFKLWVKLLFIVLVVLGILVFGYFGMSDTSIPVLRIKEKTMFLASDTNEVSLYQKVKDEDEGKIVLVFEKKVFRGSKVKVLDDLLTYEDKKYQSIKIDNEEYYVLACDLVEKKKEVVLEKHVYIRSATSMLEDINTSKIVGLSRKGDDWEVLDHDELGDDGVVHVYKVRNNDIEGYVYGKYVTYDRDSSYKNYQEDVYNPIHEKISNSYDGGDAIKLDFYPNEKPSFDDNKMPDAVYALYLNSGSNVIQNIDEYIEFAKDTNINAFVVDIKDNETPAYPAQTFQSLSPTNYDKAINSYESYKNAISKLKDNGFYVIGRITTFKDSYYVKDHPEDAILDKTTGSPYLHNGSYWPSAYNRNVWYYTLSLAKEAVREFGFNEINFDYVRFPDRMNSVASRLDLKNVYDEDKAEAIQRFVQYVNDGLHEDHVYVSIDVFGESTNGTYTTAYGQYWPAISNVADVISGMPYPDHFSDGYYGITKPWNHPYLLMKYWGSYAVDRQKECPTPARVRTWIQAYDVMKYVDSNGISYGSKEVEEEIRGLYDAGLMDGYITWLSNSNLNKYKVQKGAFQIDYRKEYMDAKNNSE